MAQLLRGGRNREGGGLLSVCDSWDLLGPDEWVRGDEEHVKAAAAAVGVLVGLRLCVGLRQADGEEIF